MGSVRIIGGQWKRSRLPVPDLPGLRPTPDRVRETLFNWLGPGIAGQHVVDVFSGTGALGLEAASRGATKVWLLERHPRLVAHLQACVSTFDRAAQTVSPMPGDARMTLAQIHAQTVDGILADPPYEDAALYALLWQEVPRILRPGGWFYLEAGKPLAKASDYAPGFTLHKFLRAGHVHAHLFLWSPPTDHA